MDMNYLYQMVIILVGIRMKGLKIVKYSFKWVVFVNVKQKYRLTNLCTF